jgi:2-hydroxycyclohexanecarboxyl-CoA dehydrogenase
MISFDANHLVIIGGGSGIGWAAAELAVQLGAYVTVADVDSATERLVASRLGAAASFTSCDATSADDLRRLMETAEQRAPIDGLLTTVGGAHLGSIPEVSRKIWDAEIAFNLTSAFLACQAVLPFMKERGRGSIVVTSSGYANLPGADRVGYTAAKAGVMALTRSFAKDAAPHGIRVNCIAPGPTDTPRFRAMNGGDEGVERVRSAMPMGRIPTPEDCARAALFLLSPAADAVTGQVLHVNGGLLMV